MKKIVLLFALLATATLYSQSIEGDWYLPAKSNFRVWSIKGDSITLYDVPFDSVSTAGYTKAEHILSITKRETNDKKVEYSVEEKATGKDKAVVVFELVKEKYPVLNISIVKDNKKERFPLPLRFITVEEIQSYASLKKLDEITKPDFITLANHIIDIHEFCNNYSGSTHAYIMAEFKYTLIRLGYNPLLKGKAMKDPFEKFKDDPETKELLIRLGS